MSATMTRLMRICVSTKRAAAISGGKRGEPVAHLARVRCTEFYPIDAETRQRQVLNTPHEVYQIFTDATADIAKADVLTPIETTTLVVGDAYTVMAVERWPWTDGCVYLRVMVEVKR